MIDVGDLPVLTFGLLCVKGRSDYVACETIRCYVRSVCVC